MKAHLKLFLKAIINVLIQLQKKNKKQKGKQINQAEMHDGKEYWQKQKLAQNDKRTNKARCSNSSETLNYRH